MFLKELTRANSAKTRFHLLPEAILIKRISFCQFTDSVKLMMVEIEKQFTEIGRQENV